MPRLNVTQTTNYFPSMNRNKWWQKKKQKYLNPVSIMWTMLNHFLYVVCSNSDIMLWMSEWQWNRVWRFFFVIFNLFSSQNVKIDFRGPCRWLAFDRIFVDFFSNEILHVCWFFFPSLSLSKNETYPNTQHRYPVSCCERLKKLSLNAWLCLES